MTSDRRLAVPSPLASIIIPNHNYGCFLREAIESALSQTCAGLEVVVVDDGSTDNSACIIAQYHGRVVPVLKENGGQTSAYNVGLRASAGEFVCFLDADDTLLPTAMERAMEMLSQPWVVKVHWPLWDVDQGGMRTGDVRPAVPLSEGDLRSRIIRDGPDSCVHPPSSGNVFARRFLESVMPIPELEKSYGVGSASADAYFSMLAPLYGIVRVVPQPQGTYRLHSGNDYQTRSVEHKLARDVALFEHRCATLAQYCRSIGVDVDVNVWKKHSWFYRLHQAVLDIASLVPRGETVIVIDDGEWGTEGSLMDRRYRPFLERRGEWWGLPADDATAISELERMRTEGAGCIAFLWPTFWWLGYYRGFAAYLRANFKCSLHNDLVVAFDLQRSTGKE